MLHDLPDAALPSTRCRERERLDLLASTQLLDTPPSESFDRITRLAARMFDVPVALVSLVDEHRQWFKSRHGVTTSETPRDISFCGHAIGQRRVLVVEDALADPRFRDNPLALGEPRIRFYAGAPLTLPSGHVLGTLCLLDHTPRVFDAGQQAALRDLADLVMAQVDLHRRAGRVHEVTQLPNRAQMADDLQTACRLHPGEGRTAMLVDVMGHRKLQAAVRAVGIRPLEAAMRQIADRLQAIVGSGTTLYHVSETRFSIVLPAAARQAQDALATRLLDEMGAPFETGGVTIDLTLRAGLVDFALDAEETADVLRKATSALHEAVTLGESHLWHSSRFDAQHRRSYRLLRDVPAGLASGEFRLVFQPKFNVQAGRFSGVEALARWTHPKHGEISPGEFIPLIESTALIHAFTEWVIDAALAQLRAWHDEGLELTVAVNVSSRNLERDGFADVVLAACARHGVAPRHLHVECTEHTVMTSAGTQATLEVLNARGVDISLDDFGMGFSNLACLSALPVQLLKLDRSLIAPVATSARALKLVGSLIEMGHSLGYRMLAEGVEDRQTFDLLVDAGCDAIQGFFLSRPLPPAELSAFIARPLEATAAHGAPLLTE